MESEKMQFKYHIITLGCQMNKNDSERLETVLQGMHMERTESPEDADLIVMNSCSVRETAEHRIYGLAAKFGEMKKEKPDLVVCVTGCMPGRDKDGSIEKRLKDVDLFFPVKDITLLPGKLAEINPAFRPMEDLQSDYLALHPTLQKTYQAFVTLQTGCNHFCTYCVVPFSRGLEVNRSLKDILAEIRHLAESGCLEVTLLGQIVNHYIAPDPEYFSSENPYKESDFAKLLWEINQVAGIERIHWTAPHPLYMTDEVIDALTLPKQVNFLHLPVQSGNDDMLKKMNRRHDRGFFIDVVRKIRKKKPDIALGTDIIVGFCGETREQFHDTVDLYKECDFDIAYTAQYSNRSHTVAAKAFVDDVPKEEKKCRWQVLQDLMEKTVLRKNKMYMGKRASVLVDNWKMGWCMGNSLEMKRVKFKGGESAVGTVVDVEIFKTQEWILWGRVAGNK